jgi:hypothetical protein
VAEPICHVHERTLPAADDSLECGHVALEYPIDCLRVLVRAHAEPDIESETTARPDSLRFLFTRRKRNRAGAPLVSLAKARRARGRKTVALFLFLSVAVASLFSFIAMTVWAAERRKEREAFYHSEVLKKIAETPGSGPAAQEYIRERQRIAGRNLRGGLRLAGMIVMSAGIGLMAFFSAMSAGGPPAQVGLIPLLVGLAIFVYGQFMAPRE